MHNNNFKINWNNGKATVEGGLQMLPDIKVPGKDGFAFELRNSLRGGGWHMTCFKGDQFVPPHIPLNIDGAWSFTVVKDHRPANEKNPTGLWLSAYNPERETNPIKRLLRSRELSTRLVETVSGDQPMEVEVSSVRDARSLPQGLRAFSFITDGVGIDGEGVIQNLTKYDTYRGKIKGATFCIHYSTEVKGNKVVPWITKIQLREDAKVQRTTAFEQALDRLANIDKKKPELFLASGASEPEPGGTTLMAQQLDAALAVH